MDKEYNALYTHYVRDYERGTLRRLQSRCIVIGETAKSYRIRLLDVIQRRLPGEEFWVRKKSIFKSLYNNVSKCCDLYNLEVVDESCRACLQRCLRRYEKRKT